MNDPPPDARPPWRRKTSEELEADCRRQSLGKLSPAQPAIVAAILSALLIILAAFDSWRSGDAHVKDWLIWLLIAAGVFLFAFVVAFLLQLSGVLSMPRTPRLLICTKCFRVSLPSRHRVCECGGTREDAADRTPAVCPSCGYDLRGTPDVCPECGRPMSALESN